MAAIALTAQATAIKAINVVVEGPDYKRPTRIANVALTAGQALAKDPTTGNMVLAQADTAPHAAAYEGLGWRNVNAGEPITVMCAGILDGFDLSALNFGDQIFLSDTAGQIQTTAGTVSKAIGEVVPGNAAVLGQPADKLLKLY